MLTCIDIVHMDDMIDEVGYMEQVVATTVKIFLIVKALTMLDQLLEIVQGVSHLMMWIVVEYSFCHLLVDIL